MNSTKESTIVSTCITGNVGTGKTTLLIKRLVALLDKGVAPTDICVLCATPDSVKQFDTRLHEAAKGSSQGVTVCTHRELAMGILETHQAKTFTGRNPRLLADFEHNFLLEDMKTSGIKPRRLKEILKFFYRGLTEMEDEKEDWLVSGEEEETFKLLMGNLTFYEGMLEQEVSNLAVRFLLSLNGSSEKPNFDYIFVDDYQNISKASQKLSQLLTKSSITIAGNKEGSIACYESYPYAQGIEEFVQLQKNCEVIHLDEFFLPKAIGQAVMHMQQIAKEDNPELTRSKSNDSSCIEVREYTSIAEEFEGMAAYVAELIETRNLAPSDVFIVSPNKTWDKHLSSCLDAQNVKAQCFPHEQILKGDPRENSKSSLLRAYTLLRLVANPNDSVSWRCWCGFNDYLTESDLFKILRKNAEESNLSFIEALEQIETSSLLPNQDEVTLVNRIQNAKQILKNCDTLTGEDLLNFLANVVDDKTVSAKLKHLCAPVDKNKNAPTLVNRAQEKLFYPSFQFTEDSVRIGPDYSIVGLNPKVVIYTGFMNGFTPSRDYFDGTRASLDKQQQILETTARTLSVVFGKATETLVVSYFQKADLESAELLDLKIERVKLEKGIRMCTLSPSIFLGAL